MLLMPRQLDALDANGIAEDQQLGAAGDLNLNGALVDSDGVAQLGAQREVELESAGNIATVVFTVYGTDDQGREIQEDVTGINGSAEVTALQFRTVTRIAADASFASDVNDWNWSFANSST
jgi:hypothetical protein